MPTKMTGSNNRISGWKLDREQRKELLQQFPARYGNVVADHVTLALDPPGTAREPEPVVGEIVGRADDGKGVEAMVVSLHGSTDRPGGGTYHITWSLADGRSARESNDLIRDSGWESFDLPMPVQLAPARWP
jgi:hypothetical protein